jgi:hypothetical protein
MEKINSLILILVLFSNIVFACDLSKLNVTCRVKHVDNERMTPIVYNELVDSHCFDGYQLTANIINSACEYKLTTK